MFGSASPSTLNAQASASSSAFNSMFGTPSGTAMDVVPTSTSTSTSASAAAASPLLAGGSSGTGSAPHSLTWPALAVCHAATRSSELLVWRVLTELYSIPLLASRLKHVDLGALLTALTNPAVWTYAMNVWLNSRYLDLNHHPRGASSGVSSSRKQQPIAMSASTVAPRIHTAVSSTTSVPTTERVAVDGTFVFALVNAFSLPFTGTGASAGASGIAGSELDSESVTRRVRAKVSEPPIAAVASVAASASSSLTSSQLSSHSAPYPVSGWMMGNFLEWHVMHLEAATTLPDRVRPEPSLSHSWTVLPSQPLRNATLNQWSGVHVSH
jgi:hypothetical protein